VSRPGGPGGWGPPPAGGGGGPPPVRPAPEYLSRATRAYYAPVDDFELMVTTVVAADGRLPVPGRGPRILLAVEGAMTLVTQADTQTLAQGEAVFVGADAAAGARGKTMSSSTR